MIFPWVFLRRGSKKHLMSEVSGFRMINRRVAENKRVLAFCRVFLVFILFVTFMLFPVEKAGAADYPQWWIDRGVIIETAVTNDFSYLKAGQLRWLVTNAMNELNFRVPDGAGAALTNYVQNFVNASNNVIVNRGQLKYAASLFYNRFSELAGQKKIPVDFYDSSLALYPWPMRSFNLNDKYPARVGEAKHLFSFWWDNNTGKWRHDFLDVTTPQNTNNTVVCLFPAITNRAWSGGNPVLVLDQYLVSGGDDAGWSMYYLCSSPEGGGWQSSGLSFEVSFNGCVIPSGDSLDITGITDYCGLHTIKLVSTGGNISLDKPVYLVKWNPGALAMSMDSMVHDDKAYVNIWIEGYAPPPYSGNWSRNVDIQVGQFGFYSTVKTVTFNNYCQSAYEEVPIRGVGGTQTIRLTTRDNLYSVDNEHTSTNISLASMSAAIEWVQYCPHFSLQGQANCTVTISPLDAPEGTLRIVNENGDEVGGCVAGPGITHFSISGADSGETLYAIWASSCQVISNGVAISYTDCSKVHPKLVLTASEPDSDRQPEGAAHVTLTSMSGMLRCSQMIVDPTYTVKLVSDCDQVQISPESVDVTAGAFDWSFEITVPSGYVPSDVVHIEAYLCENDEPTAYPVDGFASFDSFIDVDVDSDNQHGTMEPPQMDSEDAIEMQLPGKVVSCNNGDMNGNGLVDFADGYNRDPTNEADNAATGVQFIPLVINVPLCLTDLSGARLAVYTEEAQSNPMVITTNEAGALVPAEGVLRIWKKNGTEVRDGRPVSEGGDWVTNGIYTDLTGLGFTGDRCVLYLEGINQGEETVNVKLGPNSPEAPMPWMDSVRVGIIKVEIEEIDFKDSVDDSGNPENNNFDIVDGLGNLIVPERGPEWKSGSGMIGPSVYINGRKVRADVKLKITPVVSDPIELEIFSDGDLDFTPSGTADRKVAVTFDSNGRATQTFTTYAKTVDNVMDRKNYVINWRGNVLGSVTQTIYTLYGTPRDEFAVSSSMEDLQYEHLKYLLGPKINGKGEWCNGKSSINESTADSIPYAIQQNIRRDLGTARGGIGSFNPWDIITSEDGGICEDYASLMKAAALVSGIPEGKISRKSVVGSVVERPTWMGTQQVTKLLKIFLEESGGTRWVNEGVCGVETADKGFRYYDVAGPGGAIGKGGWANPSDSSDNNLWYEPVPPNHGPVIYETVEELYGTWTPQTDPPYEATSEKILSLTMIKILGINRNGDTCQINYRTEGAQTIGIKVKLTLYKWNGSAWAENSSQMNVIAQMWDNAQSVTFVLNEDGEYTVGASIVKSDGVCPYVNAWHTELGSTFTRP